MCVSDTDPEADPLIERRDEPQIAPSTAAGHARAEATDSAAGLGSQEQAGDGVGFSPAGPEPRADRPPHTDGGAAAEFPLVSETSISDELHEIQESEAAADQRTIANAPAAEEVQLEELGGTDQPQCEQESGQAISSAIVERLNLIQSALAELERVEDRHTTVIQQLHSENTVLRQGELTQALKPILLDLARLHDDVASVIASSGDELRKAEIVPIMILDVLERHGVTQICPRQGEPFDGKIHQAQKVVDCDTADLDGTIARVQRPGFIRDGNHLVRPAQVDVYRYTAHVQSTPDNENVGSEGNG